MERSDRLTTTHTDEVQALRARILQLENELAEQRALATHLERLFDLSNTMLCVVGLDGRVRKANPVVERALGYTLDELQAVPTIDRIHPEDKEKALAEIDALSKGEVSVGRTGRHLHKNGDYRWLTWVVTPSLPNGLLYAAARDVTDERRAAEELRGTHQRLRDIIDFLPDATVVIDTNKRVVAWNRAMERLSGIAAKDILRRPSRDYVSAFVGKDRDMLIDLVAPQARNPTELQDNMSYYSYVFKEGHSIYGELFAPRLNGGRGAHLWGKAAALLDQTGNVVGAIESVRDVTAQHRKEEHLRRERDLSNTLLQASPAFIIALDADDQVLMMNQATLSALGYTPEDVRGKNYLTCFVAPRDRARVRAAIARVHREPDPSRSVSRILARDGRELLIEWRTKPVLHPDGSLDFFIALGIDITERNRAREESARLQRQLIQVQKLDAIGQLAGGVAHDLNNMMTVVLTSLDQVQTALPPDDRSQEALTVAESAAREASSIARSLLTFSRQLPTEKKRVNLSEVIHESLRLLERVLPKAIQISLDTGKGLDLWIDGDPTQMKQALANLAINARDAMPEGGLLRVDLAVATEEDFARRPTVPPQPSEYACLRVIDTGCGMPPNILDRVFEPFFTTKKRGAGTGLGLSIVHGIVEAHGGYVDVQSKVGRGTTFSLLLPRAKPQAAAEPSPVADLPPHGCGEPILLAEDNRHIREVMAAQLQSLGYLVLPVEDGEALLQQSQAHRDTIRLLILNADLPKRPGLACLRDLRAKGIRTKAMLVTGYPDRDLEDELDPWTRLLRKPFLIQDFGTIVARLVSEPPTTGCLHAIP